MPTIVLFNPAIFPPYGSAPGVIACPKKSPKAASKIIHTSMPTRSFLDWLQKEVPDATQLAVAIARSGATGVSRHDLRRVTQISPETLEDLLSALVAAGQVTVARVNGQLVYRVAM